MSVTDNKLESMIRLLVDSRDDFEKFYAKGNSSAGTRLRKSMQNVKSLAQELRTDVQTVKNTVK